MAFALFIGIIGLCWLGPKGNYNKVSFANTYDESSFFIVLNASRFIKKHKNKISQWRDHWNKCIDLTWYQNQDIVFKLFFVKVWDT
jgi:hypothetical protein